MIILCDVDNVISDDLWRVKFIRHYLPDHWARYHDYHQASPLDDAVNLHLVRGWCDRIFFLTSMPIDYHHLREGWMRQNHIRWERIMYRDSKDHRPSSEVKRDMVRRLFAEGIAPREIGAAYDDHEEIVAMYREEGLPAQHIQIHKINYAQGPG